MKTHHFDDGNTQISVPECPTNTDVEAAKDVLDGFFQGFPFESEVDRVHALAMACTIVLRPSMPGVCPLCLITADAPGVGKSTLADMFTWLATGERLPKYAQPRRSDGWWRMVKTILEDEIPVAVFDNVTRLNNMALEMVATSPECIFRTGNKTHLEQNRTLWLFVGNRVKVNDELQRRTLRICLSVRSTGNVHFYDWLTTDYRKDLLWSILVLHQRAENRPFPDVATVPVLGSYDHWSQKNYHILSSAGYEGFLGQFANGEIPF